MSLVADTGYSVLTEHNDTGGLWSAAGDMSRFFVPFGQRYSVTGSAPYHEFTGKPWDPDAKLYYFPFRYYSPNMNRWTMADPAGVIDGPNVLAYVGGNPINQIDIKGLSILPIHFLRFLPSALLTAFVICGLHSYNEADSGKEQGHFVQHCVFGCKLARCFGDRRGWISYAINWYWEEIMQLMAGIPHDHLDNKAARFGATDCSRSCRSWEGCCDYVFD